MLKTGTPRSREAFVSQALKPSSSREVFNRQASGSSAAAGHADDDHNHGAQANIAGDLNSMMAKLKKQKGKLGGEVVRGATLAAVDDLLKPGETVSKKMVELTHEISEMLEPHFNDDEPEPWSPEEGKATVLKFIENFNINARVDLLTEVKQILGVAILKVSGMEMVLEETEHSIDYDTVATDMHLDLVNGKLNAEDRASSKAIAALQGLGKAMTVHAHRTLREIERLQALKEQEADLVIDEKRRQQLLEKRQEAQRLGKQLLEINESVEDDLASGTQEMEKKIQVLEAENERMSTTFEQVSRRVRLLDQARTFAENNNSQPPVEDAILEILEEVKGQIREQMVPQMDQERIANQHSNAVSRAEATLELASRRNALRRDLDELTQRIDSLEVRPCFEAEALARIAKFASPAVKEVLQIAPMHKMTNDELSQTRDDLLRLIAGTRADIGRCEIKLDSYDSFLSHARESLAVMARHRKTLLQHIKNMKEAFMNDALQNNRALAQGAPASSRSPDDDDVEHGKEKQRWLSSFWAEKEKVLFKDTDMMEARATLMEACLDEEVQGVEKVRAAIAVCRMEAATMELPSHSKGGINANLRLFQLSGDALLAVAASLQRKWHQKKLDACITRVQSARPGAASSSAGGGDPAAPSALAASASVAAEGASAAAGVPMPREGAEDDQAEVDAQTPAPKSSGRSTRITTRLSGGDLMQDKLDAGGNSPPPSPTRPSLHDKTMKRESRRLTVKPKTEAFGVQRRDRKSKADITKTLISEPVSKRSFVDEHAAASASSVAASPSPPAATAKTETEGEDASVFDSEHAGKSEDSGARKSSGAADAHEGLLEQLVKSRSERREEHGEGDMGDEKAEEDDHPLRYLRSLDVATRRLARESEEAYKSAQSLAGTIGGLPLEPSNCHLLPGDVADEKQGIKDDIEELIVDRLRWWRGRLRLGQMISPKEPQMSHEERSFNETMKRLRLAAASEDTCAMAGADSASASDDMGSPCMSFEMPEEGAVVESDLSGWPSMEPRMENSIAASTELQPTTDAVWNESLTLSQDSALQGKSLEYLDSTWQGQSTEKFTEYPLA